MTQEIPLGPAFPGIKVLPVELPVSREPHGIVTLRDRALNPVTHRFIEHAREAARHLPKRK